MSSTYTSDPQRKPVEFAPNSPFATDLRARVKEYLDQQPNGRFATPLVWCKAAVLLSLTLVLYCILVFVSLTPQQVFAVATLFAVVLSGLGLNVMHESAHGNYSPKRGVNRALSLTFDFLGVSSTLYVIKHIQFHHAYTNVYGADGDISEFPLLRLSPYQERWPVHRYQSFYAIFFYSLLTASWITADFDRIKNRKVGACTFKPLSFNEIRSIILLKIVHLGFVFVLPSLYHPILWVVLTNLYIHLILGTILALVFQVAHIVEGSHYDTMPTCGPDWMTQQLLSSADYCVENPFLNFCLGGLNFQLEHHLFPNVSYAHFPKIHQIVLKTATEYGYRPMVFPTFWSALRSHFGQLQLLGCEEGQ